MESNPKIRIFLSSTFQDMNAERNQLLKLFKRAGALASARGVEISVIDLRWGITDEDAQNGKVISTCLQEIDNSRPFFIGLIGSRYGWQPTFEDLKYFPSLLERFPVLGKYVQANMSITEMEIRYGVLDYAQDVKAAFFIKDDLVCENDNQNVLISDIRNSGYKVSEYNNADDLSKQIEHLLIDLLNELYPIDGIEDSKRRAIYRQNFYKFRYQNFFGNKKDQEYFNSWLNGHSQKLAVIGARGSGKTATVLHWLSSSWSFESSIIIFNVYHSDVVIEKLIENFRNLFQITPDIVPADNSAEKEFTAILKFVENDGRPCIVFLDAINNLSTVKDKDLLWLPAFPDNIKVIMTATEDDATVTTMNRFNFDIFKMTDLTFETREEIIVKSLQKVGKKLSDTTIRHIVQSALTGNPLILKTFINEIIAYGDHDTLDKRIEFYLSAQSPNEFFDKLIQVLEDTFDASLVQKTLMVMILSKYGLHESEMKAIIGVTPLTWSELYCWMKPYFINLQEEGSYIRDAAIKRYLTSENDSLIHSLRTNIVNAVKDRGNNDMLALYELAYQYASLEEWESLFALLMNLRLTFRFLIEDPNLLYTFWSLLLKETNHKLTDYITDGQPAELMSKTIDVNLLAQPLANFASDYFNDYDTAVEYRKILLADSLASEGENAENVATDYNNIGLHYAEANKLDQAIEYLQKSLSISENIHGAEHEECIPVLMNIGLCYYRQGKIEKAKDYFLYCKNFCEDNDLDDHLLTAYNNLGFVEDELGNDESALELYKKAFDLNLKKYGLLNLNTFTYLRNLGLKLNEMCRYEEALPCFQKLMLIARSLFGESDSRTAECASDMGNSLKGCKNYEEALKHYILAVDIQNRVPNGWQDLTFYLYKCGELELQMKESKPAIEHFWRCFKIRLDRLGPEHEDTIRIAKWEERALLEDTYLYVYEPIKYYNINIEIAKFLYGDDHPLHTMGWEYLGRAYEKSGYLLRAMICYKRRYDLLIPIENKPDRIRNIKRNRQRTIRRIKFKYLLNKFLSMIH